MPQPEINKFTSVVLTLYFCENAKMLVQYTINHMCDVHIFNVEHFASFKIIRNRIINSQN